MAQTVMVTGTSRGIGEASARLFAANGWRVAATARNPQMLGSWADASNVKAIRLDVTDSESIRQAVEEAERRLGPIDVLVNNAGAGLGGAVEAVTRKELIRLFDLNLFGLIAVTQAVLPSMRLRSSGVIVNVSSAAGRVGLPFLAPYCASKHAVEGLTEAMSYELEPFGIRVKLVEVGGAKTNFSHAWAQSAAYASAYSVAQERYATGMQKAEGPEPAAQVVLRAAGDRRQRLRYTANGAGAFLNLNRWLPESAWRTMINKLFLAPVRSKALSPE